MPNIESLKAVLKKCVLCPRQCRVDRTAGETGSCGLSDGIVMDCAMAHFGEDLEEHLQVAALPYVNDI